DSKRESEALEQYLFRRCADQIAGGALPDRGITERDRLRLRGRAVGRDAADQVAVVSIQEMQIAFGVDDAKVIADEDGAAGKALCERILLPDRCAGALVERVYRSLVVGEIKITVVDRDAGETGKVARPEQGASQDFEARHASL